MLLQVIVGLVVARKTAKIFRKESDFRQLKELGEKMGYTYIAGESVDAYRKRLMETRDQMWVKA